MCIRYTCRICHRSNTIYCPSADWNEVDPGCYRPTIDPEPHIKHKKCPTCKTVEGVIHQLRALVFQKPWLETEGLAGEENRAAWEFELSSCVGYTGSEADGWSFADSSKPTEGSGFISRQAMSGTGSFNEEDSTTHVEDVHDKIEGYEEEESNSDSQELSHCSDQGTAISPVAEGDVNKQKDQVKEAREEDDEDNQSVYGFSCLFD